MRVLVLGGRWFLGRAVAQDALARGWEVTVFNRGRCGTVPEGAQTVRGDRTVAADLARLASEGPWDAVVDTSASEMAPRDVLAGARALEPVAGRYVYVSTVNAYRGWPNDPLTEDSEVLDCPPDADVDYGRLPDDWDGPDWYYGRQKAGAERATATAFGDDRAVILRPGSSSDPASMSVGSCGGSVAPPAAVGCSLRARRTSPSSPSTCETWLHSRSIRPPPRRAGRTTAWRRSAATR
ncbi:MULTISPECIES: NAD-dependent epimerase/dehydratase family protein [unclassified Streptomyces]|uniref:NAD-dependent epimerase/dehydratase family protein n=1 Tax=unclassified Streptomyces TaxID=2593676 RepID=UPI0029BFFB0A|nr:MULTISPECIES: NAD-dependent epimerase/dehydratase family protein [unclassified Streptomyces]